MSESGNENSLQVLVAEVAAAYFSNSHVSPSEIPTVVAQIASSLGAVGSSGQSGATASQASAPEAPAASERQKLTSAQVRKSITSDALISFEDGRPYKTLKRHLSTRGMTPQDYREKWGLPSDYPMVSPAYSEARSSMAKSLGLGRKPGGSYGGKSSKG